MTTISRIRFGVCVLVWCNGQLLLMKRKGSHGAGTWSVPGGRLEPEDSSPHARAHQELLEEVGLWLAHPNLEVVEWSHANWEDPSHGHQNWVTLYFEVGIGAHPSPTGDGHYVRIREPDKCSELRWVYPTELLKMFADAPESLFEPFRSFIVQHGARLMVDARKRVVIE